MNHLPTNTLLIADALGITPQRVEELSESFQKATHNPYVENVALKVTALNALIMSTQIPQNEGNFLMYLLGKSIAEKRIADAMENLTDEYSDRIFEAIDTKD